MIAWGINALNHGSSLAVFNNGKLISNEFGASDELDSQIIRHALDHGAPDNLFWYERPWIKKARQLRAGQYHRAFDLSVLPQNYINRCKLNYAPITYTAHHASHAAAGYYTSPFNHCAVVVLDAIGEFECATIWEAKHGELRKVWSRSYPNSLGLFYSAFTDLLGMTPIQDEYLLQQMAEKGDPHRYKHLIIGYMGGLLQAGKNMHKGIVDWPHDIRSEQDKYDIAAAVQARFQDQIDSIMLEAQVLTGAESLVYMGGCAMNSAANKAVVEPKFKYIWSLPNPGDPSSSIGAVLYHTKDRINWSGPLAKHIQIKV
jgi:carbamoyltransferase